MTSSTTCAAHLDAVEPDFDASAFRHALSQFATGVTVVIARSADGQLHGLTVNSFSSVSLAPPLVLWSLAGQARSMAAFAACTHYVINVLAQDQGELALRFAQKEGDRFATLAWRPSRTGLPILPGAAAWFECRNLIHNRQFSPMEANSVHAHTPFATPLAQTAAFLTPRAREACQLATSA